MICDAVIAPGFEPGVLGVLGQKKSGRFLVFEADSAAELPRRERRELLGVTIEQDRDTADLAAALPADPLLLDARTQAAQLAAARSWMPHRSTESRTCRPVCDC